jgi:ribosomal protein L37AE/L43A
MVVYSRKVSVALYIASCPECGQAKIVLRSDIHKNQLWTCTNCSFCKRLGDYNIEYDREVLFDFRSDGTKVYDNLQ